uniref:Peptidase S8/S53 domain-containing protein n=1 Tax=Psilocybe cubensis TaxID=181762 RepID=A0A8H7Y437_PSICU
MHFFSATLITLAVLVGPVFSAPNPLRAVETYSGTTSGKYIVKFKAGVSRKQWIKKLGLSKAVDWQSVNGISSHLNTDALNTLRASDDVEYISEDGIMYTQAVQEDATWGLQRISSVGKITNTTRPATAFTYTYDDSAGEGVDIYIVDTDSPGVFVNHTQFGGRATWGLSVENYRDADGHGHGTHCAGTAAGISYGVAKKANIIAVKVLSDSGSGSVSGIVTGLDWVISQVAASGRPSIVSLSLGGSASTPLDNAIAAVTAAGIHAAVAAGNSNANAANYSPARAPSAVTVGASTILDERASFSNYGPIVDIFAPGLNVLSSWIGGTTATPHVAGLIAYLISKEGNLSPAEMSAKLQTYSVKGALTGLPSTTLNYLAQNAALEA